MNRMSLRAELAVVGGLLAVYYALLLVALQFDGNPTSLPGYLVLGILSAFAALLGRRRGVLAVVLVGAYVMAVSWEYEFAPALWLREEFLLAPLFIAVFMAIVHGLRPLVVIVLFVVVVVDVVAPWRSMLILALRGAHSSQLLALANSQFDRSHSALLLMLAVLTVLLAVTLRNQRAATEMLLERNAELQRLRAGEAIRIVAEERTAIARDIHDEVAHHVAALVVRAQAAARVAQGRPEELLAAVRQVVVSGQEALGAMRQVVRVLRVPVRDAAADAPDVTASIGAVVARVRDAGLTIVSEVRLEQGLPAGLRVAVVRTVQEALTNVLLHSGSSSARLVAHVIGNNVELDICDPGPAVERFTDNLGGGTGLRAMAERVRVLDGTMTSGPTHDGGWRVHVALPRASAQSPPPAVLNESMLRAGHVQERTSGEFQRASAEVAE